MKENVKVMKEREQIKGVLFYLLQLYRALYKKIVQGVNMSQWVLKHIVNSIKTIRRLITHVS